MKRKASAAWSGGLKDGKGNISTDSGVLSKTQYSFGTRFENGVGTNPEELIAAAHAACFTMALSGQLGSAGMTAENIETTATVTMDKLEAGWTVTRGSAEPLFDIAGHDDVQNLFAVRDLGRCSLRIIRRSAHPLANSRL